VSCTSREAILSRAIIFALLAALGCARNDTNVVSVAEDDEAMEAAIAKARVTLPEFAEALAAPKPNRSLFTLKVRFEEKGQVEHIWIDDPVPVGHGYRGRVGNDPVGISTIKLGDSVQFDSSRVSDWMFVEDGALRGGYTIRALLERASPEERARILETLDFRVE
jgi:uncharacterized protein YegJ (DUF2314 family)